eukprot:COSAG02_NODE_13018_length_1459_cov_1.544853_2_plen_47_part_00
MCLPSDGMHGRDLPWLSFQIAEFWMRAIVRLPMGIGACEQKAVVDR